MTLGIISVSYRLLSFKRKEQQSTFMSHIGESGVTNLLFHFINETSLKIEKHSNLSSMKTQTVSLLIVYLSTN